MSFPRLRPFLICLGLVAALSVRPAAAGPSPALAASDIVHPGYRSLVTRLPGSHFRLDAAVWYPTSRKPSTVQAGSRTFRAARNAPPLPGPWPLIILSHDSSGSRFSHHDLATSLAEQGFIVAAPTHDGDNIEDMRLLFSDLQLPIRARQLSAVLDLVLEDPIIGPLADRRRVGLVAFGRTGSAGLLLAGAKLTPDIWDGYCARQNGANQPSPYCDPFIADQMDGLIRAMRARSAREEEAGIMRGRAEESRLAVLRAQRENVRRAYARAQRTQRKGSVNFPEPPVFLPPLPPLPEKRETADPRFRAMALLSPGFAMLFDPPSLRDVDIPVLLAGLDGDPLDLPPQQALSLRGMIAPPAPAYLELTGDAPALQALCPPDMAADLPDLCDTVTPEERAELHERLKKALPDFFRRAWR